MKNYSALLVTKGMPIKLATITKNDNTQCCNVYKEGNLLLSYWQEGRCVQFFWEGNINQTLKCVQRQTSY